METQEDNTADVTGATDADKTGATETSAEETTTGETTAGETPAGDTTTADDTTATQDQTTGLCSYVLSHNIHFLSDCIMIKSLSWLSLSSHFNL